VGCCRLLLWLEYEATILILIGHDHVGVREHMATRFRPGHEQWGNHVRTAWAVDPQIALALVARFPGVASLKSEVSSMVQVGSCWYILIQHKQGTMFVHASLWEVEILRM
jgi:hypothetical protein